jgi:hypothetical protein
VAPTASAATLLSDKLNNAIPNIPGWTVTQTPSGGYTVNTPTGIVRIKPPAEWTIPTAERMLERLQDKGMDTALAQVKTGRTKAPKGTAANGHQIAFTDAEKTPPVYPGDPSPDDGPVRKLVHVTPTMAQALADRPWSATTSDGAELRQRDLTRDGIDFFSELLRKGRLPATYQGLGIGLNGSVYDGQHRLWAIIETGIAATLWINYNVTPDEIMALDSGRQRRASTKLAMKNYDHALYLGSAARLLHYFLEHEAAHALGDTDGELGTSDWRKWHQHRVSDLKVDEIVEQHPGLYPDVLWARDNKAPGRTSPSISEPAVATFRYLARRAWPQADEPIDPATEKARQRRVAQAEEKGNRVDPADREPETHLNVFLNAVIKRLGIDTEAHVAITLQRWLVKSSAARPRHAREAHLFALIKAWNIYVDPPKRPIKSFPEHLGNEFPLPYKKS